MKQAVPKRVEVAGIGFDPITQEELIVEIAQRIAQKTDASSFVIYKPYVEFFWQVWTDSSLGQLLHRADRVVADGVAVQWAASYLAGRRSFWRWLKSLLFNIQSAEWRQKVIPERGAGVDATQKLLESAASRGWIIGIFGGPKDSLKTASAIKKRFPGLKVAGVWSGYFSASEEAALIRRIKAAQPDILFVAQGFPRQEKLIDKYRRSGLAKVMIGEGGTFDFNSMGGDLKRAPRWLRHIGLEWLWRLIIQPKRWRRQTSIPVFMWRVFKLGQEK